jgi:hypothetical protein
MCMVCMCVMIDAPLVDLPLDEESTIVVVEAEKGRHMSMVMMMMMMMMMILVVVMMMQYVGIHMFIGSDCSIYHFEDGVLDNPPAMMLGFDLF